MARNRLYLIVTAGIIAGYTWLAYVLYGEHQHNGPACFFKSVTGVPCPSCGNTRSVIALTKGEFKEALWLNPLGYVVAAIMLVMPFWLLYDVAFKKSTLFLFYRKFEKFVSTKPVAIVLITLVIINWIWNIQKGL